MAIGVTSCPATFSKSITTCTIYTAGRVRYKGSSAGTTRFYADGKCDGIANALEAPAWRSVCIYRTTPNLGVCREATKNAASYGSRSSARDEPDALQDARLAMNNSINQSLSFADPASDKSKGPASATVPSVEHREAMSASCCCAYPCLRRGTPSDWEEDEGHLDNHSLRRVPNQRLQTMTSSEPIALTGDAFDPNHLP